VDRPQSSEPFVTMMDMLLVPDASAMMESPSSVVQSVAPEINRDLFISKVE